MSPMNWIKLFMLFSYLLTFIILINYFSFHKSPLYFNYEPVNSINENINLNWKW
nr:ATP synthase F0 subunit 8 [Tegrolcinia mirotibialis]